MAPGTTLQNSLGASHQEPSPIATASAPHPPADLKGQDQPSSQDLDFAKLKKANGAVQKLISLAEERQSDRTFFQRASDWILRVKQPETIQLEVAKINLQKAEKHLTQFERTHSPQELQQAKEFEKKAFSEVQNYHSKYSDYQEDSLNGVENVSTAAAAISIVTGGAALLIGSEIAVGVGATVYGGTGAFAGKLMIGTIGGTAFTGLAVLGISKLIPSQIPHLVTINPENSKSSEISEIEIWTAPLEKEELEKIHEKQNPQAKSATQLEKELIEKANKALLNRHAPFDYNQFFIWESVLNKFNSNDPDVNSRRERYAQILEKKWNETIDQYKKDVSKETGFENQVKALMGPLIKGNLRFYEPWQASYDGMVEGLGTNCEGREDGILAPYSKLISTKKPWVLGVQTGSKHNQTVLYNTETREVWDLYTGEISKKIRAPIYHPHIVLAAFLEGRGIQPPIPYKDLLIQDMPESEKKLDPRPIPDTNSKRIWKTGVGVFEENRFEPSIDHRTTYQVLKEGEVEKHSEGKNNTSSSYSFLSVDEFVNSPPSKVAPETVIKVKQSLEKSSLGWNIFHIGVEKYFVYTSSAKEEVKFFKTLSPEEGRQFLLQLARRTLSQLLSSKAAEDGIQILEKPEKATRYSPQQIEEIVSLNLKIEDTYLDSTRTVYNFFYDSLGDTREKNRKYFDQNPLLAGFRQEQASFESRIRENPIEFIKLVNSVPHENRKELIRLIMGRDLLQSSSASQSELNKKLSDPTQVGIGVFDLISVEIQADEKASLSIEDQEIKVKIDKKKQSQELKTSTEATVYISPECFIDFVIYRKHTVVNEQFEWRWDKKISEDFKKLNRDGRYDEAFLNNPYLVSWIISNRSIEGNTLINPLFNGKGSEFVPSDIYDFLIEIKRRKLTP